MAFHEIGEMSAAGKRRPPLRETVRATVAAYNGAAVARFSISEDVFTAIGSPAYCRLLIGSGKDAGRIAVEPCASKKTKTHTLSAPAGGRRRLLSCTAERIGIAQQSRADIDLPFTVTDDGLVIDIRPLRKPVAVANAA